MQNTYEIFLPSILMSLKLIEETSSKLLSVDFYEIYNELLLTHLHLSNRCDIEKTLYYYERELETDNHGR